MSFRGGGGGVQAELLQVRGHGRRLAKGLAPIWVLVTLYVHISVSVKRICVFSRFVSIEGYFSGSAKIRPNLSRTTLIQKCSCFI